MSSQEASLKKSSVYFSKNVRWGNYCVLARMLGVEFSYGKGKFLGLPYLVGRSKKEILNYIRERVDKKTREWKEKYLT